MSSRSELEGHGRKSHLRASYVWRDEVMADVVATEPRQITVGTRPDTTFTTPELGLPPTFAIIRPGARGYLLTLGAGMTGRLKLGGEELAVNDFVARGHGERADGAEGAFRATSINPGDWGVIHLDGRGQHNFFFQFVPADPAVPGARWRDTQLVVPAIFFAVLMHAFLLLGAFKTGGCNTRSSLTFPGKREIMADYLLNRPQAPPPPEAAPRAGDEKAVEKETPKSTVGKEGKAGGEGKEPRARAPDPDKGNPDEPAKAPEVGLLTQQSREQLKKVRERGGFDEKLGNALERLKGPRTPGSMGGSGPVAGFTGYGPGAGGPGTSTRGGGGTGGGGKNVGDVQTHGAIDTGGTRAARGTPGGKGVSETKVKVDTGTPDGELGGLTAAEILKVVKSRQNGIRNCYERELQRNKDLGGKVVISWRITAEGLVQMPKVRSTTMRNGSVEDCIVRQISGLKFPQPRGGLAAKVNFPFLFAPR
jgi:hypothetical protein